MSWTPSGFQIRSPMTNRPTITPPAREVFLATMIANAAPRAARIQKDFALGMTMPLMLSPTFVGSCAASAALEVATSTRKIDSATKAPLRHLMIITLTLLEPHPGHLRLEMLEPLLDPADLGWEV